MFFATEARAPPVRVHEIVSKDGTQFPEKGLGLRVCRAEEKRTSDSSVFLDCFDDLLRAVDPQSFICFAVLAGGELWTAPSIGDLT